MMKCLQWFKALIADRQFDGLQEEFKRLSKERGGYFMPKPPYYDFNDESIFYVDLEIDGQMLSHGFPFSEFVEKRIEKETNQAMFCISKEMDVLGSKEKAELSTSLTSQIDTLNYINEKSDILGKREQLNSALTKIAEYVNSRNTDTSEDNEDVFYSEKNLFGYPGGSKYKIRFLYDTLVDVGLFDPYDNQFDNFYQILITPTSTMIVNLQHLTVDCDNYKAAYILHKIEPLFSNLNFKSISDSGIIYNRLGKPFNESGLGKAKSIFLKRSKVISDIKDEIDRVLSPLIAKR